jgi:DNA-binding IclR family transcriptional regulator
MEVFIDMKFLRVNSQSRRFKTMLSTTDILTVIEEEIYSIKQLAKKLEVQKEKLENILKDLSEHKLVEYDHQTEK